MHPSIDPSQRNTRFNSDFNFSFHLTRRHALVLLTLLLAFTAVFTVAGPHAAQAATSHTAPQTIRPISGVFVGCAPGTPSGFACSCPAGYVSQGSFDTAQCVAISVQTYKADDSRLNGTDAGQSVAVYCNTDGSLSLTPILPGGSGDTKNVQTTAVLTTITATTKYGDTTVFPGPPGSNSWLVMRPNVNGDGKNYFFTVTADICPAPIIKPPTITASFNPSVVDASGDGKSTLTLTITNPNLTNLTNLTVTNTLSLLSIKSSESTCRGGEKISNLASGESCTITFHVKFSPYASLDDIGTSEASVVTGTLAASASAKVYLKYLRPTS